MARRRPQRVGGLGLETLEDRIVPAPVANDPFLFTPVPDGTPLALHIHPHLTIIMNGQTQTVPQGIGIKEPAGDLPLHTHDATGIIHVESPVLRTFYLQDVFSIWGQPFTRWSILGARVDGTHQITFTVNGQTREDFGDWVLHDHDDIVIRYELRAAVDFAVSADHALWERHDASGWATIGAPGTVAAISPVADGSGHEVVFVVTADHALFRYGDTLGWQMLGATGTVRSASAGVDSTGRADVLVLGTDGSLTCWSGAQGWLASRLGGPGSVLQASAANAGRVVVVGADQAVLEFDPNLGWFPLTGAGFARSVSAVADSSGNLTVFAQTFSGGLFRYTPVSGWNRAGGDGTILSASAGLDGAGRPEVVVLTTNHAVAAWNSVTSWSVLAPPAPAADLVASTTGRLVAVLSNGALFAHDEVFGWFALTGPNFAAP